MSFKLTGTITEKESGAGLPGLVVRVYDKDLMYDDLLASTETGNGGKFKITYEEKDYQELFDAKPDIYLEIKNSKGETIFSSEDKVRFGACDEENFDIEIPRSLLPTTNDDVDDKDIHANLTAVDLQSLVDIFGRAHEKGKLEEVFSVLQEFNEANPETDILLPKRMLKNLIPEFTRFAICAGATGTAVVTINASAVISTYLLMGIQYSYTGAPPCVLKVQNATVASGAITMGVRPISDTGSVFTGSIQVPLGGGALLTAGLPATISATFTATTSGFCNTCILPTPTVTATSNIW